MSLKEFNRFWQAIPRTWENMLMANHAPLHPNHLIPTTYFQHLLRGTLLPESKVIIDSKLVSCILWQRDGRSNFTLRLAQAQMLSELKYLRNTVFEVEIFEDDDINSERSTHLVLCSSARSQPGTDTIRHLEFNEFVPYQENLVGIPVQYCGVEDEIKIPEKFKNATIRYQQYASHVDLYWYGDEKIPAYISVDVRSLEPPERASVCLSDIKLHPYLHPVSTQDLDSHKIMDIHLDLPVTDDEE